jgi:signal transduction histidine kinase
MAAREATVDPVSTGPDPRAPRASPLVAIPAWMTDVATVGLIAAIGALQSSRGGDVAGGLFTVGLALPLLLRRRYPVGAFAAIAAIALVQWFAGVHAFGDAALLVALYTVAANRPPRELIAVAVVLEVGIVLASARWGGDRGVSVLVGLSGMATAAGVLGVNVRHRRELLASLRERAARLEHERDQQGRLSAAAERSRIAREMHDIVAHNLSVIIALADGASFAVRDTPDRAESAMQSVSRTGRQALTEMRRLLGVLRADGVGELAPQPGLGEIDALVEQVREAGLPVRYEVAGDSGAPVPPGLALAAYRIVQEALTNTLKHAGPGAGAQVRLAFFADAVDIEITDSGAGRAEPGTEGGGLRGMRERAAVYDGIVQAGPREEGGWRVATRLAHAGAEAATGAPA